MFQRLRGLGRGRGNLSPIPIGIGLFGSYWDPYNLFLLGQWLNFKLFGITYLVGRIKFKLFFQGPLAT